MSRSYKKNPYVTDRSQGTKYKATIHGTIGVKDEEPANILFNWPVSDYTHAHQFKLDVNRIARKKNYLI